MTLALLPEAVPLTLETLDDHLPPAPKPVGSYVTCVRTGNLILTSGMLPLWEGKIAVTGQVGSYTVNLEAGQHAARLCALNALAVLKAELGDLRKIARVVKVVGFVNSAKGFSQQPAVINGASNLLVELFGEAGKHARSAVGVAGLPLDAAVEVELMVELH